MYLTIDIGGTKTLIAAFSRRGRVVRRRKFRTAKGYVDFIRELSNHLLDFRKYKILGVAVAIPGVVKELPGSSGSGSAGASLGTSGVEQKNYSISFGNRNWGNIDLLTPIKNVFNNCPVWFENDANLATLYEGYRLSGRVVFLTFSTGIGGGIVEKNRILPESAGFEPGHWMYEYRGETKEWEDIAAASAIGAAFHVEHATTLRGKKAMTEVAERVALGLSRVVSEYQPKTIILGGPLGRIFRLYKKYLPEEFSDLVRAPKRPNESVIYGGYLYAKRRLTEK